jgi:hypothetical protein
METYHARAETPGRFFVLIDFQTAESGTDTTSQT